MEARPQLLTYLAVMRELRIQERKENSFVQGFFSDGMSYYFITIKSDGTVIESQLYDSGFSSHLKFFNWVVKIIKTAVKLSSHPSPRGKKLNDAE